MVTEQPLDEALERAAEVIGAAKYTVALVGAGISVESGIPPFRGPGGLWTKHGEPAMDGYQKFMADPTAWWAERLSQRDQHSEFMKALDAAKPNPAHLAMAEMEKTGFLHHIITQNIDNMHQVAGSEAITEIHGNRLKLRCIACNARFPLKDFSMDEVPPLCPHCQGMMKTDTVMFGEPIPMDALRSCQYHTSLCDCMLLVGTSAVVYPAAEFPIIAARAGASLVEINPMETPLSGVCQAVLRAPAGEIMPKLVERLREMAGPEKQSDPPPSP
jgi:NAD-dependent deacetylase